MIIVALIGFLGDVLVPFIEKGGTENQEKPLLPRFQVTHEYFLELSQIELSSDATLNDSRFFKAPKMKVVTTCRNSLEDDSVCVRIGKPRLHENTLPLVPRDYLKVESEFGGRRLVTSLDSKPFIREQYKSTPHGIYRVEFEAFDPCKPNPITRMIEFNYVYKEDFMKPHKVLNFKSQKYGSIAAINGGLEIRKWSTKEKFVSAYLNQEFDFKTNYCISGFFILEFEDDFEPGGFDIAICDKWGEKLSVVFADGPLNAFSIKMHGDEYRKKEATERSRTTRVGCSKMGKTINNFFKIRIWQDGYENRCTLYFQQESPNFRPESCVHERIIDASKFIGKFIKIRLKLWKPGVLKLYNFEVAEVK